MLLAGKSVLSPSTLPFDLHWYYGWALPLFHVGLFFDYIFFEQLKCRTLILAYIILCWPNSRFRFIFFCIITTMNLFNLLTIRFGFIVPSSRRLFGFPFKMRIYVIELIQIFKYCRILFPFYQLWTFAANKFYNQNVKCEMFMTFSLFSKEKQFNFRTHEFN